jgi:hypothetical protein
MTRKQIIDFEEENFYNVTKRSNLGYKKELLLFVTYQFSLKF